MISLRFNSAAICLFSNPAVTMAITSRSRGLSESMRLRIERKPVLLRSLCAVERKGFSNCLQQFFLLKWLGEKLHCARLHDLADHRNIAVRGHEDNGQIDASCAHLLLECYAADSGQPHIEQQAARTFRNSNDLWKASADG